MKHYAIEGKNLSMKGKWISQLLSGKAVGIEGLEGKKGLLFSTITLEQLIDDELKHDRFVLSGDSTRSIRTFSSGEQRKSLLDYLVIQNPDFLVLDNPFDCLDVDSVEVLKKRLKTISQSIPLVQIFKRKSDILSFITDVLVVNKEDIVAQYSIDDFNQQHIHSEQAFLNVLIPPPLSEYKKVDELLIDLKNVTVHYESRCIVKNINWQIKKGEFWHLKGPNGSGKTTLLSMIYGDNPKAYGQEIYLFGNKKGTGESVWGIKEKIGYFTPAMIENFHSSQTVEQMVISGLVDSVGLYMKPTDRQRDLAWQWLKLLDLEDNKEDRFYRLSQVNQRMVLIARAMIKHPPLLVLDEPSTGMDDYHASLMVQLIQKIADESKTAILYVSHRTESGHQPSFTFELLKTESGSEGRVV